MKQVSAPAVCRGEKGRLVQYCRHTSAKAEVPWDEAVFAPSFSVLGGAAPDPRLGIDKEVLLVLLGVLLSKKNHPPLKLIVKGTGGRESCD